MKENIFTLTRREQRAIIAIILLLLIGTVIAHYQSLQSDMPAAPSSSISPTPAEEDSSTPESPAG